MLGGGEADGADGFRWRKVGALLGLSMEFFCEEECEEGGSSFSATDHSQQQLPTTRVFLLDIFGDLHISRASTYATDHSQQLLYSANLHLHYRQFQIALLLQSQIASLQLQFRLQVTVFRILTFQIAFHLQFQIAGKFRIQIRRDRQLQGSNTGVFRHRPTITGAVLGLMGSGTRPSGRERPTDWRWRIGDQSLHQNGAVHMRNEKNPNVRAVEVIATSIYITNFPKDWNEKIIWNTCQEFGVVVDVYMSPRLTKNGKRFAFVRFIRVSNVERLVSIMASKWYGNYHLYACMAKFPRKSNASGLINERTHHNTQPQHNTQPRPVQGTVGSNGTSSKTYVAILKKKQEMNATEKNEYPAAKETVVPVNYTREDEQIIHLTDADLLSIPDASTIVLAKVKDPNIINCLNVVLDKEGFKNVDITYMGGSWLWIEFDNRKACTRFKQCDVLKTYFLELQNLSRQFVVDDKIIWVEMTGMPVGAWTLNAFRKVAATWGEVVFLDKGNTGGIVSHPQTRWRKRLRAERHISITTTTIKQT
ncbi:hypothetical protein LXL04_012171 [Taraxacum kok-saghyz]